MNLLPQLGTAKQGQPRNNRGLALPRPHLRNQSTTVWGLVPNDEFQAHQHAHNLGMVRKHQQVKSFFHQLCPPEENLPQAVNHIVLVPARDIHLREDVLNVALTQEVPALCLYQLEPRRVVPLRLCHILQRHLVPPVYLTVLPVALGKVLLVEVLEEKQDGLQRRQYVCELVGLVSVNQLSSPAQEKGVFRHLVLVDQRETQRHVRRVHPL
mmetsp:Transcript_38445/g.92381  ORF Transcript_38445/g.92381 Transcript_38445/m.92381 type:complete len:211 (-) Transcript_38445:403-1035(-)